MNTRYDFVRSSKIQLKEGSDNYPCLLSRFLVTGSRDGPLLQYFMCLVTGPTQVERIMGIEPTSSAWKAVALTVVLYPQMLSG